MLRAWLAMSPGWPAGAGPMSPSSFILISLFTMRSYRAAMKSWRGGEGGGGGKCDECQTRFQRRRFRGDASSSPTLFSPPPPLPPPPISQFLEFTPFTPRAGPGHR